MRILIRHFASVAVPFVFLALSGSSSYGQSCWLDDPTHFFLICQTGLSGKDENECYRQYCGKARPGSEQEPGPGCIAVKDSRMGFFVLENECDQTVYLSVNGFGINGNASCSRLYQDHAMPPSSRSTAYDDVLLSKDDDVYVGDGITDSFGWCQSLNEGSNRCRNVYCPAQTQIAEYSSSTDLSLSRRAIRNRNVEVDVQDVAGVQSLLARCGFEPGPIDGVWGRRTEGAARAFVTAHGGFPFSDISSLISQVDSYGGACPSGRQARSADRRGLTFIGANLSGRNLTGYNFSGEDLSNVDLSRANLTSANLNGTNLTGADLSKAILINANLSDADLTNADVSGVSARGASFRNATLRNANLRGSDMRRADLSGARLQDASVGGMRFTERTGIDLRDLSLMRTDSPDSVTAEAAKWLESRSISRLADRFLTIGFDRNGDYVIVGE